jgi:hypothetical protein
MNNYRLKNESGISNINDFSTRLCNCIGPQNGQPLCPCQMAGVKIVDGRYVKTTDLGPAPTTESKKP